MNVTALTTTSTSNSMASSISDEFITLLSAQMMNQDPTDPLESHELTAQYAQIAALEQQEGTNDLMENLVSLVSAQGNFSALTAVGKEATVLVETFSYNGESTINGNVLMDDVNTSLPLNISITDADGDIVTTFNIDPSVNDGEWSWDGSNSLGEKVVAGDYTISASQQTEDGATNTVNVTTTGTIDSLNFLNGLISLDNGTELSFGNIITISNESK